MLIIKRNNSMNKRTPTAAQARYRMRFSTHAVPNSATKSVSRFNRMWLGQAMAFVAVFSLIFSSVSPLPVAKATAVNEDPTPTISAAVPNPIPTTTIVVTDDTSAGENIPGWMFNRDTSTDTPFAFDNTTFSIGTGSLHILPIGANPADKMVAENFINAPISTVNGITYDFKIGAGGDANDDEQFYMNVYANFGVSDDLKYYDCRYDVVPTIGSTGNFTTVSFDPTQAYPVTTRGSSPFACPPVPADMDLSSAGSNFRMFALNVGDTSASDSDLDGFLDKVVVSTDSLITTYDFEPAPPRYPITVNVQKVWQDANGTPIDAPEGSKDDITITVNAENDEDVCEYNAQGVLTCDGVINTFTNETINIVETGLPVGWEVVPSTVGNVTPVCPQNVEQGSVCNATVINKLKVASPCGLELVANGGFELPEVTNGNGWEVFPSGTAGMGWSADWVRPAGAPADARMELHEGVNSWTSHDGNQHTELDADWAGPSGGPDGEDASLKLYQDLITKNGGVYNVSVWTSPRPGTGPSENVTEVRMGGIVLGTIIEDGTGNSNTVWTEHTYTFTATSGVSRLSLTDLGTGNSLGAFIDDVSVKEECLSDVTICKLDNSQNPLSGWDVFLKGELLDTVTVNSTTGVADLSDALTAGEYVLEASGTYTYRPGSAGDLSDAAFSERVPEDANINASFYAGDYLPWVRNLDLAGYSGYLGVRVNNTNFDWGTEYKNDHKYAGLYTLGADGQIPFSIIDDNYSDNSGTLTVKIYSAISGTTGEDGCVTLDNVDYGTYTLDELLQEGWVNVNGKGTDAIVDMPTESFTLVNNCVNNCASTVEICKLNAEQQPLSNWQVYLKGPKLETVNVNSNSNTGANSVNTLTSGQQYLVVASGEWTNRAGETVDPKYVTMDNWVNETDAPDGGYSQDLLEMQVNGAFVEWGPYTNTHSYNLITAGNGSTANFRVFDDADINNPNPSAAWYGDNVGTLAVDIYPIFVGTTGQDGCVTLEDVPYGSYKLDEIMKQGWENVSGKNTTAIINTQVEEFTLVNRCAEKGCEQPIPQLHLIKVVCDEFSDVAGNEAANNADETDNNFSQFSNYNANTFTPSPLVNGLVSPTEINTNDNGCARTDGWSFGVANNSGFTGDSAGVLGATTDGEFVTPISGPDSDLSLAQQEAIANGQLWVKEITQPGYQFATLRCYNDALNGDNLEYISLGDNYVEHIYCIAYNVLTVEPCVLQNPAIASGIETDFQGLAVTLPTVLTDESYYPNGTDAAAVAAGPTGYPGAWDGPQNDTSITEGSAFWVSNSVDQPTNPPGAGGDGSIDTWRLFSHTFTIPADAASISPATLYFSADNEVTAFLDDVQVGTNNSFATAASAPLALTPGQHTLKFAVQNWAFQPTNNPTGLIYNLDFTYCGSDTTQGEPEYHVSGTKWNDDGDGIREEESGIEDWAIHLTRKVADFDVAADSSTGTDTPVLVDGKTYLVKATGTFDAGDSITADAQYSDRAPAGPWTDLVQAYESYGPELLDLQMNGSSYDWGMYNSAHAYWLSFISNGTAANFKINDVYYPNNTGSLNVEVYEVIETDYTDSEGDYHFNVTGLGGDLYVVEGMIDGWHQTAPVDGVYQVTGGQNSDDKDFGNHQVCMPQNYDKKVSRLRSLLNILVDTQDEGMPYCGNGISGTKTQTGTDDNSADGWTIYLDLNHNNALDDGEPYDVTDSDGDYSFSNLPTGTYHVREANQEGWTQTVPGGDGTQIVDVFDSVVENIDFTNNFTDGGGNNGQFSIAGKVYHDNNSNNGTLNETEEGLQTWVVYLDEDDSNTLNGEETSVNTDSNGNYLIEGLVAGCYTVREVTQADWVQTEPVVEDNEYHIGLGGAIWPCNEEFVGSATNSDESGNGIFGFLFKTANAADLTYNFPGNAIALNFGNIEADRGGSNGGGGSSGSRPNPPGRVLGDSTTTPNTPQVLGATTLPVTGSPTWVLLMIALFAAPMLYFRKLAVKRA